MKPNKIKKPVRNFVKINLLRKILLTSGIIGTLGTALTSCHGNLGNKKYDIKEFSIIDTLKIDTMDEGLTLDHLYDYLILNRQIVLKKYIRYNISKNNIKFETTCKGFTHHGSLYVRKEEESEYKPINAPFVNSEKIKERNYLVHKFYSLDKNLKINELSIYGAEFKEGKPYFGLERTYTRDTDLGKKVLSEEQKEVERYLDEIKKHKKIKSLWKD